MTFDSNVIMDDELIHYSPEDLELSMEGIEVPYPTYYYRNGVRLFSHLTNPKLNSIKDFHLTRNAISHYVPELITDVGPDPNHFLVKDAETRIATEHITQYAELEGPAILIPRSPQDLVRRYIRINTKARLTPERVIEKILDQPRRLILENYAFLNHRYRWRPTPQVEWYKFNAMFKTVYSNVHRLAQMSDRQQYFRFLLPEKLPTISDLRRYEKVTHLPPSDLVKRIGELHGFWVADIWTWLGKHRENSLLSKLDNKTLSKMDFIIAEGSSWSIINLGMLDNWRNEHKDDPVDTSKEDEGNRDTNVMQLSFLRYLTTMVECRNTGLSTLADIVLTAQQLPDTVEGDLTAAEIDQAEKEGKELVGDEEVIISEDEDADKLRGRRINTSALTRRPDTTISNQAANKLHDETDKKITLVKDEQPEVFEQQLETELSVADDLETENLEKSILDATMNLPEHERNIMIKANDLASKGLISATQYRRIQKLSTMYKELENPFGEGSFVDLATITPEDSKLPPSLKSKDDPRILDKSMLETKLPSVLKAYSDHQQYKHMAAMVLNLQQGGFAISKFEVSEVKTLLDDYLVYTIKVNPIEAGIPSTLTFRIPRVQEDGTYVVNGIRCVMRPQRIDTVIRKVGSDKVYITSYYSKIVISKSEKVVNNFKKFLYNQLTLKINSQNSDFSEVNYYNSFDNYLKVSEVYAKLSTRFKSFKFKEDFLYFVYKDRIESLQFKAAFIEELENRLQGVLCGKRNGLPIILTTDGEFILIEKQGALNYLGDVLDYFELNGEKLPPELVEIKIAGEKVPLGFIIAYLTSFDNLVKLVGGEIRRHDTGERLNLTDREFAVQFLDKTLVFSKTNKKAVYLLSGFAKAKGSTKQFPMSNFTTNKEVYFTLIEETIGAAKRILREALLMKDLFIDPITKDLLKIMGEPTEFIPLLIRANELLETDWYPDENDPEYQRIRGYERFAGFSYKEMINSIKAFNNKRYASRSRVELHPDAIYRVIDKDVSKVLVQESNPIHNSKEKEIITFGGTGGRSNDTMMKKSRSYHEKDLGVIGESVPDNKSVGLVAYMAADPNIIDMYGRMERKPNDELTPSSLQTTASLVSAASDTDDKCLILNNY